MGSLLRADKEIIEIYDRNVDTVYRVSYSFMKNRADTEDMVQEAFLKLITCGKMFESAEHEKAWLIVTASNLCRNELKRRSRRIENIDSLDRLAGEDVTGQTESPVEENPVLEAILNLPDDYKTAIYMYYYEGYAAKEIAGILRCPHSTIRSRLARARKLLKNELGGEFDEK